MKDWLTYLFKLVKKDVSCFCLCSVFHSTNFFLKLVPIVAGGWLPGETGHVCFSVDIFPVQETSGDLLETYLNSLYISLD